LQRNDEAILDRRAPKEIWSLAMTIPGTLDIGLETWDIAKTNRMT